MAQQTTTRSEGEISAIMRKVHSGDTAPEMAFRKALWARGIRYRVAPPHMPGKPDVVIPSKRVVVFVDGDFWHGNQWRRRRRASLEEQFTRTRTQRREYWLAKIRRNMQRDCKVTAALMADGWTVLRFWESDIRGDVIGCVQLTVDAAHGAVSPSKASSAPLKTFAQLYGDIGYGRAGMEDKGWSLVAADDGGRQEDDAPDERHSAQVDRAPSVTLAIASFPTGDPSLARPGPGLAGQGSAIVRDLAGAIGEMGEQRPPLVLLNAFNTNTQDRPATAVAWQTTATAVAEDADALAVAKLQTATPSWKNVDNVAGLLASHGSSALDETLSVLNRLDYTVDAFVVGDALFVVGVQEEHAAGQERRERAWPDPLESDARPWALADFIRAHAGLRWAIRDLPPRPERAVPLSGESSDNPQTPHDSVEGEAGQAQAIAWITEYYLNPVVCELMRGRPLRADRRRP